jgi:hypothetical protein
MSAIVSGRLIGIAVALALALASGAAHAQGAMSGGDEQTPGDAQVQPLQQEPPAEKKSCVTQDVKFTEEGKQALFVVTLDNTCEMRLSCNVSAYVVNSQGPQQLRQTLTLAPKSQGPAAQQRATLKLKHAGGMANVSHQCKPI